MVSLGDKLGLYKAMAGAGPMSSQEVARRSGCAERYVREWLNAQVAGGYVDYHAASATYELTPEQAAILADPSSHVFLPHGWKVVSSMWADEAKALDSFKSGKGVSWGDHNEQLLLRRRCALPQRLHRQPCQRVAAGAQRRHRQAAGRRQSGRCRMRARPFHRADGQGLPQQPVLGLRCARGIDCNRPPSGARSRCRRPRQLRGGACRRLCQARLRPDLFLRLPARHGQARRCGAARGKRHGQGRHA